jgi:hypothetical protein
VGFCDERPSVEMLFHSWELANEVSDISGSGFVKRAEKVLVIIVASA